jgi:hypothetical protein
MCVGALTPSRTAARSMVIHGFESVDQRFRQFGPHPKRQEHHSKDERRMVIAGIERDSQPMPRPVQKRVQDGEHD